MSGTKYLTRRMLVQTEGIRTLNNPEKGTKRRTVYARRNEKEDRVFSPRRNPERQAPVEGESPHRGNFTKPG